MFSWFWSIVSWFLRRWVVAGLFGRRVVVRFLKWLVVGWLLWRWVVGLLGRFLVLRLWGWQRFICWLNRCLVHRLWCLSWRRWFVGRFGGGWSLVLLFLGLVLDLFNDWWLLIYVNGWVASIDYVRCRRICGWCCSWLVNRFGSCWCRSWLVISLFWWRRFVTWLWPVNRLWGSICWFWWSI